MRYLCLIHLDLKDLGKMPRGERSTLNAAHWDLNDSLRASGNFLIAESLDAPETAACVRVRQGKRTVTDGPFAETKEMIAGFYVIEARDMAEAVDIASRIPAAALGTVEVRPAAMLEVDGHEPRWG
jgi:hypothetical protein